MLVAVPLGVAFAIGLDRWRGPRRRAAELPDAVLVRHARDLMGVSMFLLVHEPVHFSSWARARSSSGSSRSRSPTSVIIVRGRLLVDRQGVRGGGDGPRRVARGGDPTRAAAAARARRSSRASSSCSPTSIDDFVIVSSSAPRRSHRRSRSRSTARRARRNAGLNALATIMLVLSLLAITVAVLILRWFNKRQGTGAAPSRTSPARDLRLPSRSALAAAEIPSSETVARAATPAARRGQVHGDGRALLDRRASRPRWGPAPGSCRRARGAR